MQIDRHRQPAELLPKIQRLFDLSAGKILSIEDTWRPDEGAPVFTVEGRYRARGWTEWTQGFQFGSALLQFDATGDEQFLDLGRTRTLARMAPHLTHMGVHDHGFNNVSTYGALWRLAREKRIDASEWEVTFYELALKVSGAVQAHRWTSLPNGGFIHSFNGAHSLFIDTMRSLRSLALAHVLGQRLMEEQDASVSLIDRLLDHAHTTAQYNVYPAVLTGDRARSRATPRSARGRAASPGRCWGLPSSSSFSRPSPVKRPTPRCCSRRRSSPAITTSTK
jgi:unsaturated chondroitin disaccharide hydrolase